MLKCGFLLVCSCCYQANWFVIKSVSVVSSLYLIFWCIWRQSPLRTFVLLLQRNTIGRFYTVDTVLKGLRPTLLTALCQCPKTNYKGLTDKASSFLIFRQANRICIRFYFRKICLHTTLKNRAFVP